MLLNSFIESGAKFCSMRSSRRNTQTLGSLGMKLEVISYFFLDETWDFSEFYYGCGPTDRCSLIELELQTAPGSPETIWFSL